LYPLAKKARAKWS